MSRLKPGAGERVPAAGVFATTHWSVVVCAQDSQSPGVTTALERLCQTYWYPLYVFVRRKGYTHEDASDLTQAFFARLLQRRALRSVDASLGKFRTFLLTSLANFLTTEWEKSRTLRRGGGAKAVSLDEALAAERYQFEPADKVTPEILYERRWAQTLLDLVVERLARETEEERFEILKGFLLGPAEAISYDDAAARLGLTVPAITSAIHRMRGRFRALLREEVAHTVEKPEDIDGELRHLLSLLAD
jgi:DNA-directed RNA polymerase specialized sigma24 family protein